MAETMTNWGVTSVFGMVGHSNLGLADALRLQQKQGPPELLRHPSRGRRRVCLFRLREADGQAGRLPDDRRPGRDQPDDRPVGRQSRSRARARADRAGRRAGPRARRVPGDRSRRGVRAGRALQSDGAAHVEARGADDARVQERARRARRRAPDLSRRRADAAGRAMAQASGPTAESPPATSRRRRIARDAMSSIGESKRPIVIVGYGARGRDGRGRRARRALNAPVLTTFKAKGQISDRHPLAAGVLGRSGTPVASWFMNECDLILAFGSSFSNHTGITPKRPIIQVDFDRMTLGKFHAVTVPVWGEIGVHRGYGRPRAERRHGRSAARTRGALGDLARREAARSTTIGAAAQFRGRVRALGDAVRTTRSSRSTSATTPIPSAAISRARPARS